MHAIHPRIEIDQRFPDVSLHCADHAARLVPHAGTDRHRLSERIVVMIVRMLVDRERARHLRTEQGDELGVARDRPRGAGAAHMPIEAHHGVRRGHDQVQIVRDQKHPAAVPIPDRRDQPIELALTGDVDPGERLVEYEQPRLAQQRPCEQHAVQLSSGDFGQGVIENRAGADLGEQCLEPLARRRRTKGQKTPHGHRQDRITMHVLRRVADAQAGSAHHLAATRPDDAEQHPDQGRLARAVESDQGHDLAGVDGQIHRFEHVSPPEAHAHPARLDERQGLQGLAGRRAVHGVFLRRCEIERSATI